MKFAACLFLCGVLLEGAEPARQTFDKAVAALASGDYPAAERGFRSVLRQQPRHVGALGNLGILYARTNRSDEAIAVYRRALKLSPGDPALLLNLGLAYLKQEAHARALPLFDRAAAADPHPLQARQLAALCRVYTGQVGEAIRELEALRASAPADTQLLFLLGFAYLKKGDAATAQQVFERMFAAAPAAEAQFLLGRANYEAALFPRAEESFLEVQRLDPRFPGLHVALGKLYMSQRRTEDAMRELALALKENPADADANYYLGGLLVLESRFGEAIPYLERAREQRPDSWATFYYLGKARLQLEQPEQAVALLERATALNTDEASAYYQLGRALQACGREAEARRALGRVRELKAAELDAAVLKEEKVAGTR